MAFEGYLSGDEIRELYSALIDAKLVKERDALFTNIDPRLVANFPDTGRAPDFLVILNDLNRIERLVDGSVPLEQFLQNAVLLAGNRGQARTFSSALGRVTATLTPLMIEAGEILEEFVHENDLVPATFLLAGSAAMASVALVRVPEIVHGKQLEAAHRGTSWLVAPGLVITNYHVIKARTPDAVVSDADLQLQVERCKLTFGYDADTLPGTEVGCTALEAASEALDYAILRLAEKVAPPPLRLSRTPFLVPSGERRAVNIIQHPAGGPKQVALRNNVVTDADASSIRYYAGTANGSSGSPVFDDHWKVVGLHCATRFVENMRFNGRPIGWVNRGVPLLAILEDLRAREPAIYAEIDKASPK